MTVVEDIEELASSEVVPRIPIRQVVWKTCSKINSDVSIAADIKPASLPCSAKVFVKTWGCSHNNSDGEYMSGLLAHAGYEMVQSEAKADLCLLNSCTVKNPSEDVFMNAVRSAAANGRKVVVAGCVPQGDRKSKALAPYSVVGVQQIDRVVEVVEQTMQGNTVRLLSRKKSGGGARLDLPKIRRNPLIEILPINQGCLNECTYCKTKHSRGNLQSYTPEQIVDRAKQVIAEGVCEIWLSSEDTGAYGRDIGTSLPEMLWQLIAVLPAHVMLRIGMTNPPYILEHLQEIGRIMQHPRVYAFLHVPIQAASDRVLDVMKRKYTLDDFCKVVDTLRRLVSGVSIATDIICGFPTETESEFDETIALIDRYQFASVHISQFYARRGTPAARMKRVPSAVIKQRSRRLSALFNSYETHSHQLNEEYDVLCTELSSCGNYLVAHNKSYEQILVAKHESLLGSRFRVRVVRTSKFFMVGEILPGTIVGKPAAAALSKLAFLAPQFKLEGENPSSAHSQTSPPPLQTISEISQFKSDERGNLQLQQEHTSSSKGVMGREVLLLLGGAFMCLCAIIINLIK